MVKTLAEIIKSCSVFSTLEEADLQALSSLASVIEIKEGETLFHRGDNSRDAYIIISGKLVATTATPTTRGELIGYLMPNELVGEMSLLAADVPRSLTITASADSTLLQIHQADFEHYCLNKPKVAFKMLEIIIKRTQGVIRHLEKPMRAQFIAFLPADEAVNLEEVIIQLKSCTSHNPKVVILQETDIKANADNLGHLFLNLKQQFEYVLYPISIEEQNLTTDILIKYADKIVLFGYGDQKADMSPTSLNLLNSRQHYAHVRNELVLLYKNSELRPFDTRNWLKHANFFRHHHIYLDQIGDIQRLGRFMTGKAIGLVLGGGGTRGWAHIGALKALMDANIPIDAVAGTSVGSVAGGCYLSTPNFESLHSKYQRLQKIVLKSLSLRELTLPLISLFSGKSATTITRQEFDFCIEDLPKPFFCISCNITKKEQTIHKHGKLWEIIRASASLPGIVPPTLIDKQLHVDGGVVNNLPVNIMSEFLENSGTIIAVSLVTPPKETQYSFPPIISLWDTILIKCGIKKQYLLPSLFYTFVDSLLMGSYSQQQQNMKKADILVQPDLLGYTTLSKKDVSAALISLGYKSTKQALLDNKLLLEKIIN